MSDESAQPKQSSYAKAFLPGLLLGLVVGLLIGAVIPPLLDSGPQIGKPVENVDRDSLGRDGRDAVPVVEEAGERVEEAIDSGTP